MRACTGERGAAAGLGLVLESIADVFACRRWRARRCGRVRVSPEIHRGYVRPQALAGEALRQRAVVQERTSWRQAVSEVLTAAAAADGPPSAPLYVLAAWLSVLPWLADSRWRRLRTGDMPQCVLLLWSLTFASHRLQNLSCGERCRIPDGGHPHYLQKWQFGQS